MKIKDSVYFLRKLYSDETLMLIILTGVGYKDSCKSLINKFSFLEDSPVEGESVEKWFLLGNSVEEGFEFLDKEGFDIRGELRTLISQDFAE
jgi:hypothetical protein